MAKIISRTALALLLSVPLVAAGASAEAASCQTRKANGTVIGGIGGALLGNSISHGGGGLVLGGLGGAVVGRQVAKSGCKRVVYRAAPARTAAQTRQQQPATRTYYDQYGRPVTTTSVAYR